LAVYEGTHADWENLFFFSVKYMFASFQNRLAASDGEQIFNTRQFGSRLMHKLPVLHGLGIDGLLVRWVTGLCGGRMEAEASMQLQQLLETPVGYILKK
jgi:hypothetical protein